MACTISKEQMERIIYSYHWDPFQVLGYQEVEIDGKKVGSIRGFLPDAKTAEVKINNKLLKMEKVHNDGMFEVIIEKAEKPNYSFKLTNNENHSWELKDPYKYSPVLTDFDLHLFGEGNHYRIFEKLGSHLIEHEGTKGVLFAVWAPNAKRVSIIGNFNHWDGRRNQMRTRGASGIWELFIPDLVEGEVYKYEVKTQDDKILQKADPYAFRAELRPKTASMVHTIGKYKWNDKNYMEVRDKSNHLSDPTSIYEVHLGSWKRKDNNDFLTYRELADDLVNYVAEMGYTHIELMPITEHPFDGSWGYQVTGFFAPTSRFGTPEDFCYFVDKCHEKNIGVLMDWVPAHFPTDAHGLAQFDGTALYEHADPRKGFHKDWTTFIFNYGRNEVRNFLISNALFWLDYYHIDGLRVDAVASLLYLDYARKDGEWIPNQYGGNENLEAIYFIKRLNEQVYLEHPGVLMIAEESTAWAGVSRPTYLGGLGFELKWNMGWMNDFLFYMQKDSIHKKYHHNNLTFSMIYAFNENFVLVLSHDEVVHGKKALISKMPGDDWQKFANLRTAIGYMYGHPGKKLMFMGGEFGQWNEWNAEQSLDWHLLNWDRHRELQLYFKNLNRVYKENPALYEVDFQWHGFEWVNCNDWENSSLSFIRRSNDHEDAILVLANFTPVPRYNYRVGVPKHCHWDEILNSDAKEFGGSGMGNFGGFWSDQIPWDNQPCSLNLTIPPLSVLMFKPKKEEK
ncbi:MAG: 1,4-alpha-glucan branching enzyme [Spirochaetes bacterium GWC1_27_15]|nr:MAG: 1,4-alpha-glucan branching enzyme [Spirochaetes bacterium GWB1_27_13]OHD20306.1 MAG: 1,4-alpha-glucan branching enzyme [Spirochaetes bacterium GWC1_27_15]